MKSDRTQIHGDEKRAAVDALKGYVYQLYQSAIAWIELEPTELLALEVAEDYATLSGNVLQAVQVKAVAASTTINTDGVVRAIESLVDLRAKNPHFDVSVRYLSTAEIGLEKENKDRVLGKPTLECWKKVAKSGNTAQLRQVLLGSKVNDRTKEFINSLDENQFREHLLRKIHFDCGAPSLTGLQRYARAQLLQLVKSEGGTHAQSENLENALLHSLLMACSGCGERILDRNDLQKIVDSVLRVSILQPDLDRQNALLASLIAAPNRTESLTTFDTSPIRPIPPLPEVFVIREKLVSTTRSSFEKYGIAWLHGASGMGKTLLARTIAFQVGGIWSGATLRGLDEQQASVLLFAIADALPTLEIEGLIIDDLDEAAWQKTAEAMHYLAFSADRNAIPVIVTSPYPASTRTRYALSAGEDLSTRIHGFDETEVGIFIDRSGGNGRVWKRYVHLASGGGHPQLTQGLIRNLQKRGWPQEEIENLTSLFEGNEGIEEIRTECRRRLLGELPPGSLALLQRLSLHVGRFPRRLAIDVSAVATPIANAGFLLDDLIGPWIDQLDTEHLQISPLLSDLAKQSLTDAEQKAVHAAIADSHTKGHTLNTSEMYAAVFSALQSQNESAATKFCVAVLQSSKEDLERLNGNLDLLSRIYHDKPPWPGNPSLNLMFRGVQLLLALHNRDDRGNFLKLLSRFESEATLIEVGQARATTELMIYAKLLVMGPSKDTTPGFLKLIEKLFFLLRDDKSLIPEEIDFDEMSTANLGVSIISFIFILQLKGIRKMGDLLEVFEFISGTCPELREELLGALDSTEVDADMFIRSAWLAEDAAGTIDPVENSQLLEKLENISKSWSRIEVAIAARKHRAIILDEYGNQSENALKLLNDGLIVYGLENTELLRAKAKVLYRSDSYSESLSISRTLIEKNEISSSVERAFLSRQAAICAEKLNDYPTARNFYLMAREAAKIADGEDMIPMASGLLVDASLAAWQAGDRTTCLNEIAEAFGEIGKLNPATSLRTAHVRAVSQHILLWLERDATGKIRRLEDGSEPLIYPGCVSNPDPHVEIGKRDFAPIGLSLYILASVECACDADSSVTSRLDQLLPNGRFVEGEALLWPALLGRALRLVQAAAFHDAWEGTINEMAYFYTHQLHQTFDIRRMTPGVFPKACSEQLSQFESQGQLNLLLFCGFATICESQQEKERLIAIVSESPLPPLNEKFLRCITAGKKGESFNEGFASLIHLYGEKLRSDNAILPVFVCLMGYNMAQVLEHSGLQHHIQARVLSWYKDSWRRILRTQRFHLVTPILYAPEVERQLRDQEKNPSPYIKLVDLIIATLPMTSLASVGVARRVMSELKDRVLAKEASD